MTVAVLVPSDPAWGAKATEIMQSVRPCIVNPRLPPHVCVSVKSVAFAPPSLMLLICMRDAELFGGRDLLPRSVKYTTSGALAVLIV